MLKVAFLGPQLVRGILVVPGQAREGGIVLVVLDQTQQFVPSIAIGSIAEIVTMGRSLLGGSEGARTVILTWRETATALLLSVAVAVSAYEPGRALLQTREK